MNAENKKLLVGFVCIMLFVLLLVIGIKNANKNIVFKQEKIVEKTFFSKINNQFIFYNKNGYIIKNEKHTDLKYFVVFTNGDTSIITESTFKRIKKGDKLIFKTIIVR